jgi:K(+)-stimulated pyrophosphate-energized sodium pump
MEQCHGKKMCHGNMANCHGPAACKAHMNGQTMIGKCDMSKCSKMSKEECAKMCDSLGCSPQEKEMCMNHFGPDGKFIGGEMEAKSCCKDKKDCKGNCKNNASCEGHH